MTRLAECLTWAHTAHAATDADVTIPDIASRVRSVLGTERRLVAELQGALAAA